MKIFVLMLLIALYTSSCRASVNDNLLDELNKEMDNSKQYLEQKEHKIDEIKNVIKYSKKDDKDLLVIYDNLFQQYYDYQYDSAMVYTMRGLKLAEKNSNNYYKVLNLMHRALLLALEGYYSDGQQCLKTVDCIGVPHNLLHHYWNTRYLFSSFWNDYYRNSEFKDRMKPDMLLSLRKAMQYTSKADIQYYFYLAMYYQYLGKNEKAINLWRKTLKHLEYGDQLYAQAACNIAICYSIMGRDDLYEQWMTRSAIGDIRCSTRQTAAMGFLAAHTFGKNGKSIKMADKFINFALADAKAYNSKLRMMGMAQSWPTIVSAYQQELTGSNEKLRIILGIMSVLLVSVVASLGFIYKQNKKLANSRLKLRKNNAILDCLNNEIEEKNRQLLDVNTKREALTKVYIDLCEKYIERFKNFKTLVSRKIKTGQVRDLQSRIQSSEFSQEEATNFLNHFDKAFLQMYPTFVNELNLLLKQECQIAQPEDYKLSSELRIAALIRLGVKDASEMANLLFYSPQTVYNYRWTLKNKALNKDNFENSITQLCIYK